MRTTIKVSGLRELGESMKALGNDVALRIAASMTGAAAKLVKTSAIQHVISSPSVDTGRLRDSIIVKKIPRSQSKLTSEHIVTVRGRGKAKVNKKTGIKQTEAPHASLVEFGTVNMPAEPFLRPSFDENKEKAIQAMKETGHKRIEAAARKAAKGPK